MWICAGLEVGTPRTRRLEVSSPNRANTLLERRLGGRGEIDVKAPRLKGRGATRRKLENCSRAAKFMTR